MRSNANLIKVLEILFNVYVVTFYPANHFTCILFRVESGRAGCFSPKVNKKDIPRKSLRSRFSLGKSSKDAVSVAAQ